MSLLAKVQANLTKTNDLISVQSLYPVGSPAKGASEMTLTISFFVFRGHFDVDATLHDCFKLDMTELLGH